ncbi:MAG: restriction endonuclease subunit S [Elusimicrobiales bacterium]|nr:restriction endonuclease subunit S [Elusimicrobiales bacterium]
MKPYPAYKDSGIEWIGKIPKEWDYRRVKSFIDYNVNGVWGDEPTEDTNNIVCVRVADFDMASLGINKGDFTYRNIPESQQRTRLLSKNDILIEKSGGGEKQPVGRSVSVDIDEKAVCSNFIGRIILKNNEAFPRYVEYLFVTLYINGLNQKAIKQTTGIQNLDTDIYFNEFIYLPSLNEQRAIATYLDRKTSQIDDLIAKKERLIELLKEERTAIINQAVTKGLDPNVEMKDSGIEWIGKIPKDWDLKRLKYCFNFHIGWTPPTGTSEYFIGDNKWATIADMKQKFVTDTEMYISDDAVKESEIKLTPKGSLLYSFKLTVGKVAFAGCDLYTNEAVISIIPNEKYNLCFYYYLLPEILIYNARENIYGAKLLNQELIKNSYLILPTPNEQKSIATYLDRKTAQIDTQIEREKNSIELLKEYRTALISEVVTGKIDVRSEVNA